MTALTQFRYSAIICCIISREIIFAELFFEKNHFLNYFCFQVHLFPKHVLDLHMNQEVGFAKEYEEIRFVSVIFIRCQFQYSEEDIQNIRKVASP